MSTGSRGFNRLRQKTQDEINAMAQFDVYKYDLTVQLGLTTATTAFYYRQEQDDTSNALAIATNLSPQLFTALWTDYLKKVLAADTVLIATRCQKYAPEKDAPFIETGLSSFGEVLGDRLGALNAQIVTKYPGTWSRNFICRNFIGGAPEVDYTGDRIVSAAQTVWQDLADVQELLQVGITTPETLDFDQVCFSATLWKAFDPLTQPITDVYSVLNSVKVQAVLGTQRKRRPNRNVGPAT